VGYTYTSRHRSEVAAEVISSIADLPLKDRLELLKEIDDKFLEDRKTNLDDLNNTDIVSC